MAESTSLTNLFDGFERLAFLAGWLMICNSSESGFSTLMLRGSMRGVCTSICSKRWPLRGRIVPLGISTGDGGLSRINPVGLNKVKEFSGFGLGESGWAAGDGVTDILDLAWSETGVRMLSGNWNLSTLNSKCNVIEVCLVVRSSLVGLTIGALCRSSSEMGNGRQ